MRKDFKLQPVLNYRQVLEAEARQRLAAALEDETGIDRQLGESRERLLALCSDLEARQRQGIDVGELMLCRARIDRVDGRVRSLESSLAQCREGIVERRQELCVASRDKKLLERLKEKFGEERRQFDNRQETIRLDEISLTSGRGDL